MIDREGKEKDDLASLSSRELELWRATRDLVAHVHSEGPKDERMKNPDDIIESYIHQNRRIAGIIAIDFDHV